MISFSSRGSFQNTEKYLKNISNLNIRTILESQGQLGVQALISATPKESGIASTSWDYKVVQNGSKWSIVWTNTNVENGFSVAVMLQYGYGTRTGGYVQGRDYINPAIKPIFDSISETVWKAVKSA